jgi:hypothetical protein
MSLLRVQDLVFQGGLMKNVGEGTYELISELETPVEKEKL